MELLYDVAPGEDEAVRSYTAFPLQRIDKDMYRLIESGPLGSRSTWVRFEHDGDWRIKHMNSIANILL